MKPAKVALTPASECQHPADNLTGRKFGRLTAIEFVGRRNKGNAQWRCLCDCGKESITTDSLLKRGITESCGCLRDERRNAAVTKHGHSRASGESKTYQVWANMKDRCLNPDSASFPGYGARGITVCERWLKFENFLADMGEQPSGLQIDRKDNDKGYNPENCRWATRREQQNNTRSTRFALINGVMDSYANHARRHGLDIQRIQFIAGWAKLPEFTLDEKIGVPLSWLHSTATLHSIRKSKLKV